MRFKTLALLSFSLFSATLFLLENPATAQQASQPYAMARPGLMAAPKFPFFGMWNNFSPARVPAPSQGPVRHSASTSCLPGQLRAALADVSARFGQVTVISTFRKGARIRGGRPSHHASCRAVDFKPVPGTYARVAAYLRQSWDGGVGTYSSGHIHIDVGENYRWHSGR